MQNLETADRDYLNTLAFFQRLSPQTREQVFDVMQRRVVSAGAYLFREGEPGTYVFVIQCGEVSVLKRSASGHDVELRKAGSGEIGGMTSLSGGDRSASFLAKEEVSLLMIPDEPFLQLLSKNTDLMQAVIGFMSGKVRGKTATLANVLDTQSDDRYPIAFFDAKAYDRRAFNSQVGDDLTIHYFEMKLGMQTAALAEGHPVVCAFVNDVISAEVIERLANGGTQLIAMRCAGYNNVDLKAAQKHGVSIVRVPAYSPHAVAEHAMALVLTLNRKTHKAYNRVREGNFTLSGLEGFDLFGRTMGIVGLGKIGRCFAEISKGFGMNLLGYDTFQDQAFADKLNLKYTDLDELLETSDVVSLHAPLLPATYHMIDEQRIERMKQGALLINTSRGGLIDSKALIGALKTGKIGGAGLDVFEEESDYFFEDRSDQVISSDLLSRLMTFNNVLITSHQAFLTHDALENIAQTTLDNIREFKSGRRAAELTNVVSGL